MLRITSVEITEGGLAFFSERQYVSPETPRDVTLSSL